MANSNATGKIFVLITLLSIFPYKRLLNLVKGMMETVIDLFDSRKEICGAT